jgi:hypothetical protein
MVNEGQSGSGWAGGNLQFSQAAGLFFVIKMPVDGLPIRDYYSIFMKEK